MDQFSHCQGVKYAKKYIYYLIIPPFFVNYLMSLVLQILRFFSGCLFSQSGQIPRFPILPTLGIPVLCLFFSLSIALFGNQANHTVFLTESDVLMGTGNNEYGQLSVPVVTSPVFPYSQNSALGKSRVAVSYFVFNVGRNRLAVGKYDGQPGTEPPSTVQLGRWWTNGHPIRGWCNRGIFFIF